MQCSELSWKTIMKFLAHTAGKLRKNRIRVLAYDQVMVEMTFMI